MTLIDSIYINKGGGKVLLEYLLKRIIELNQNQRFYLLIDVRNKLPEDILKKFSYELLNPSIFERYLFYNKNSKKFKKIFCFGNVPPQIKTSTKCYLYFHQPNFFDRLEINLSNLSFLLKRKFISFYLKNTDYVLVQSTFVQNQMKKIYGLPDDKFKVLPFFEYHSNTTKNKKYSFFYPSLGYPHKNHKNLIKAFKSFYESSKRGELILTISSKFGQVKKEIEILQKQSYPIINIGEVSKEKIMEYYERCSYVIYPSLKESFGLGLVEAIMSKCYLIASDLEYVHAICKPSLVFNPSDVKSIEKAFLNTSDQKNLDLPEMKISNCVDQLVELIS